MTTGLLDVNALSFLMEPESFMLFTGAGLSVESGLPLWSEIKESVLRRIFVYARTSQEREEFFRSTYEAVLGDEHDDLTGDLSPEYVTWAFHRYFGRTEHNKAFTEFLEGEPSDTYYWLSRLLASGAIRNYCTVNLDELLEKALCIMEMREGFAWHVYSGGNDNISHSGFALCKLHGTLSRYDTWCISTERVRRLEQQKRKFLLDQCSRVEHVLFYGYSGRDPDIADFFADSLNRGLLGLKGAWFCTRHEWDDKPLVAKTLEDKGIRVQQRIAHDKSEQFFKEWAVTLDIRDLSPFESVAFSGEKRVFANLSAEETSISSRLEIVDVPAEYFSDYPLVLSAPSPFILAGDYGIYLGGAEVFYILPVRSWIGINQTNGGHRFTVSMSSTLGNIYGADYLRDISERLGRALEKIVKNAANLLSYSHLLGQLGSVDIKLHTEVPPRAGLEDNLTALVLLAIRVLWDAVTENSLGGMPRLVSDVLPTLFQAEYMRRRDTGYLHLLPGLLIHRNTQIWKRFVVADRHSQLPDIREGLDHYESENAPDKMSFHGLLDQCKVIPLGRDAYRVSLAVFPRSPLPGTRSVSTHEAVQKLLYREEAEDFSGLRSLAILTECIRQRIQSQFTWSDIGAFLSAYCFPSAEVAQVDAFG